jgi:hypothetical protein
MTASRPASSVPSCGPSAFLPAAATTSPVVAPHGPCGGRRADECQPTRFGRLQVQAVVWPGIVVAAQVFAQYPVAVSDRFRPMSSPDTANVRSVPTARRGRSLVGLWRDLHDLDAGSRACCATQAPSGWAATSKWAGPAAGDQLPMPNAAVWMGDQEGLPPLAGNILANAASSMGSPACTAVAAPAGAAPPAYAAAPRSPPRPHPAAAHNRTH